MRPTSSAASTWIVTPDKFLTAAQVAVVLAVMEHARLDGAARGDSRAVRNAAIVETLLGTGLRVSEVCALNAGDLFLDTSNPQVLVRNGKGGKKRLVAISSRLAIYLRDYLSGRQDAGDEGVADEPLFRARDGHITRSAVHRIWKEALALAGLSTRWGVHATRHSYAVEMYRKTKDLRLTQRQLGHSSPTVTMVYASLLDEDVRRGVEAVWLTA